MDLGLPDIFHAVKARENTAALQLLPSLVKELDSLPDPRARWAAALQGVFAGNLFDLGSATSSAMFASGQVCAWPKRPPLVVKMSHVWTRENLHVDTLSAQASFHATRERLRLRPWVIDDLDAAVAALADPGRYNRHIVMLVDNAGSDVVLGMLPLARMLLASRRQCSVVLGANELPSINDVTAAELSEVLDRAALALGADDVLAMVGAGWSTLEEEKQ